MDVTIRKGEQVPDAPRVSVVIPSWRRSADSPDWLDEALASVRAQSFRDFEIIVVDDGSPTPVSPARTDDLVLIRQPNTGPGGARNRAFAHARGSLVALLDSDDRWRPEKLARQVALHDRRPELVLSCTNVVPFDEKGLRRQTGFRDPSVAGTVSFEKLFHENCVPCASVMMRKDALERTPGMHPTRRMGEDYGLWLRMALLGPIAFLDEVLLERRMHGASLMQEQLRDDSWLEREREVYEEFLDENPQLRAQPFVRRALARLEFQIGWTHLVRRDFRAAREAHVRSLTLHPLHVKTWIDLARGTLRLSPRARR